jgi:hypothetical protein
MAQDSNSDDEVVYQSGDSNRSMLEDHTPYDGTTLDVVHSGHFPPPTFLEGDPYDGAGPMDSQIPWSFDGNAQLDEEDQASYQSTSEFEPSGWELGTPQREEESHERQGYTGFDSVSQGHAQYDHSQYANSEAAGIIPSANALSYPGSDTHFPIAPEVVEHQAHFINQNANLSQYNGGIEHHGFQGGPAPLSDDCHRYACSSNISFRLSVSTPTTSFFEPYNDPAIPPTTLNESRYSGMEGLRQWSDNDPQGRHYSTVDQNTRHDMEWEAMDEDQIGTLRLDMVTPHHNRDDVMEDTAAIMAFDCNGMAIPQHSSPWHPLALADDTNAVPRPNQTTVRDYKASDTTGSHGGYSHDSAMLQTETSATSHGSNFPPNMSDSMETVRPSLTPGNLSQVSQRPPRGYSRFELQSIDARGGPVVRQNEQRAGNAEGLRLVDVSSLMVPAS